MHDITSIERHHSMFTREERIAQKIGECVDRHCDTNGCPIIGQREMCSECSFSEEKKNEIDHIDS